MKDYTIQVFKGIDQSKSENRLDAGSTVDACNMDTENGDLAVARGYVKHLEQEVPGTGAIRRLYVWRDLVTVRYVVIAGKEVYAFTDTDTPQEWKLIHTYEEEEGRPAFSGLRWKLLECRIGDKNYLLIANGERQIIKWDGAAVSLFGSGEKILTTTVSTWTVGTRAVVLADDIPDIAKTRMEQVGVVIAGVNREVESVTQNTKTVILKEAGTPAPAQGNEVYVRGGLSDARVNFLAMHYSRLFACGDMDHPTRLYWSQPPGDTRTIEDWSQEEASENASGGHMEIGDTTTDPIIGMCSLSNQLLIFKRASIYRLLGDRPSNYRVMRVHAEVEPMQDSSLIIYGDTPFWMTNAGMYYHDGQASMPMPNARQIRNLISSARLTMCKATENRDRLYFTIREGDTDSYLDNAVIVYDVPERTYMIRRGFNVADLCSAAGKLYMVNENRLIYRFDEGDDYDGKPIHAYWHTPVTDLNNKPGIKAFREMYFRGNGGAILITASIGEGVNNYRYLMPESDRTMLEVPLKSEGRVFTLKFENEAGSRWHIKGGVQMLYEPRQRTM